MTNPTGLDIAIATRMAQQAAKHPVFDQIMESGIAHGLFGGICFALVLFVFCVRTARAGEEERQQRVVTTLLASLLAAVLSLPLVHLVQWPPPYHHPLLERFYVQYLDNNPNVNSFPSQSTAVYAAISVGISTLSGPAGTLLWVAVALLGALPRMYVGGHYFTDILAGLGVGLLGFAIARWWENRISKRVQELIRTDSGFAWLWNAVVFIWLLEIAVEFREVDWARSVLLFFLK